MRVLSLNCWGIGRNPTRFEAIANAIVSVQPDVVCLQEVVTCEQVKILDSILSKSYRTQSVGIRFSILNRGGLYTGIRKDWNVTNSDFVRFGVQGPWFHPLALSDWILEKGWQVTGVATPSGYLQVFNTHMLGSYGWFPIAEQRAIQSQRIQLEKVMARSIQPLVLCADTNAIPSSFYLDSYLRNIGEIFDMKNEPITVDNEHNPLRQGMIARIAGRGKGKPNKRIDYIFFHDLTLVCGGKVLFDRAIDTDSYKGFLSDHFALLADFI